MNYIWDLLLEADKEQIPRQKIIFELAKRYSPYMEISFENLNTAKIEDEVKIEVNPYYRFYSIFKDLFHPDNMECLEARQVLLDILLHYLGFIDLKQGLCKREYYMRFIENDILQGIYGEQMAHTFKLLNLQEKHVLLSGVFQLYTTGVSLLIFKKVMRKIFKDSTIYQNNETKDEVLIYVGEKKSELSTKKLQMLCEFFLPLHTKIVVYWEYHFCILDVPETARINEIALY